MCGYYCEFIGNYRVRAMAGLVVCVAGCELYSEDDMSGIKGMPHRLGEKKKVVGGEWSYNRLRFRFGVICKYYCPCGVYPHRHHVRLKRDKIKAGVYKKHCEMAHEMYRLEITEEDVAIAKRVYEAARKERFG